MGIPCPMKLGEPKQFLCVFVLHFWSFDIMLSWKSYFSWTIFWVRSPITSFIDKVLPPSHHLWSMCSMKVRVSSKPNFEKGLSLRLVQNFSPHNTTTDFQMLFGKRKKRGRKGTDLTSSLIWKRCKCRLQQGEEKKRKPPHHVTTISLFPSFTFPF